MLDEASPRCTSASDISALVVRQAFFTSTGKVTGPWPSPSTCTCARCCAVRYTAWAWTAHPDQPEWLGHVNASILKVKLALSIIGISSIHLLKTFINAGSYDVKVLMWQTIIHVTFLASALAIAYTDKLINSTASNH